MALIHYIANLQLQYSVGSYFMDCLYRQSGAPLPCLILIVRFNVTLAHDANATMSE